MANVDMSAEGRLAHVLGRVPGVAVARVADGRVTWTGALGVASVLDNRPMTAETACLWFSMTKIVTATVAVAMSEQGELDLDGR